MTHALHLPHVSRRGPLLGFIILMHAAFLYYITGITIDVPIPTPDLSWVDIAPDPVRPKPVLPETNVEKPEKRVVVPEPEAPPPVVIEEQSEPIKPTELIANPIVDTTKSIGVHRIYPSADPRHPVGKPEYPPQAIRMNQEGLVVVNACVQPNGRLVDLSVTRSSGFPVLDAAAIRHLGRPGTRFLPGTESGQPATICVDVPIRFSIEDR